MESDPISIALRHLSESRAVLETLIISSERFDYRRAKSALTLLDKKVKELAKVQSTFQSRIPSSPNLRVVDFTSPKSRVQSPEF